MCNPTSHRQRLRTLAEGVLACYDLQGASLTLVSDTANAVFHVAVPSGRPQRLLETGGTGDGAAYALRLRPPGWHRTQAIAEELQWLLALRRDTDLVVPEPVPACDGTLIQEISDTDTPGPWQGVLFRWVPGERRTETLTPPDLERVGTCMARLQALW
jgi:Ser/Thr protein kinase RdoA (MazF antagonist)